MSTDQKKIGTKKVHHLAAYGLGSPFPEDSKLCAALSTFWPAVAPDASRSMSPNTGNQDLRSTVAPMTDEEIGQTGALAWDGIAGPKVITLNGADVLDCASFLHVDYVKSALEGRFTSRLTARVSAEEYRFRMLAMGIVYKVLGGNRNDRFVVSFRKMTPGDAELQRAQLDASTVLNGNVYRIDIILGSGSTQRPHPTDFRRMVIPIQDRQFFLVSPEFKVALRRRSDQTVWSKAAGV